eukprot:gnl/Chilomastix_cuspidata/8782.p1 GENE.gnl/Chilomastix_cuspidata/8782~~gnl/Chilomastix_cuspidata/8782.p1  ORF type:complete len:403 (+),score=93.38 gnl/Chilomastix_cuspidata/8782:64-1272(+)
MLQAPAAQRARGPHVWAKARGRRPGVEADADEEMAELIARACARLAVPCPATLLGLLGAFRALDRVGRHCRAFAPFDQRRLPPLVFEPVRIPRAFLADCVPAPVWALLEHVAARSPPQEISEVVGLCGRSLILTAASGTPGARARAQHAPQYALGTRVVLHACTVVAPGVAAEALHELLDAPAVRGVLCAGGQAGVRAFRNISFAALQLRAPLLLARVALLATDAVDASERCASLEHPLALLGRCAAQNLSCTDCFSPDVWRAVARVALNEEPRFRPFQVAFSSAIPRPVSRRLDVAAAVCRLPDPARLYHLSARAHFQDDLVVNLLAFPEKIQPFLTLEPYPTRLEAQELRLLRIRGGCKSHTGARYPTPKRSWTMRLVPALRAGAFLTSVLLGAHAFLPR